MLVKYEPISIKIGTYILEETLNKTMQKAHITYNMCLHYLGKFEVTGWAVNTVLTRYILINHRIATNTTDTRYLKNRQTCSKLHHFYITCSKCSHPAPSKISAVDERDDAPKTSEQSQSCCSLNVRLATWWQRLRSCVRAGGRYFEHMM